MQRFLESAAAVEIGIWRGLSGKFLRKNALASSPLHHGPALNNQKINKFKFEGERSERGLQDMGLMETVEIRGGRRADFHRSHKPGEARRGAS